MKTVSGSRFNGKQCILCEGGNVEAFLDLGHTALANKFLTQEELRTREPTYPLQVGFCHDCKHVQLIERVPPVAMFADYLYISSASDTLHDHLYDLSDIVVRRFALGPRDLVVDIGCNDATLLSGFQRHGVRTLGVDPAANLAEFTRAKGIDRYVGFFNRQTADEIVRRWGAASVITATNTFPHIPGLSDFVEGINKALAPGGVFIIEAHYLVDLLEQIAFDTIYHEHVSYWALGPMDHLFGEHGLEVVDVERVPIHHGQLRVFVQRRGEGKIQKSVRRALEVEKTLGLDHFATFQKFADKTQWLKQSLHGKLERLRSKGKRVVGYGAPAKGNTLLSFLEIGPEQLLYIADRSPLKQGRYTPGTHIPVVSPERLLSDQPDFLLLLAWNFAEEIIAQQADYRRHGGKFIIPLPEVKVV